jgi:uncharacterized membrane protein
VTRFIKILSIIIIATILILVIVGILAPRNTYFTKTQIIKSPTSVVWRKLMDIENYPTWQPRVKKVDLNEGSIPAQGKTLQFYLTEYDSTIFHEAEITKLEDDNTFAFSRKGRYASPLLNGYNTTYSLKGLLDGTTEISVSISYNTVGFITKIYNQIYLRGKLGSQVERNLNMLKSSIEKM